MPGFTITRAAAILMLLGFVLLTACGGGSDTSTGGAVPEQRSFESFESYLAQTQSSSETEKPNKVVFIGIDGATWRFLDPLIEQGRLPNLARIKREGASGILRSTPSYVSPPAWASMFCGYSPAKSGVYAFGKFDREARKFETVTAADVSVPSVWDVASRAGKTVAVTNVPLTHPVRPVNGIMVSGLMVPVPVSPALAPQLTNFTGGIDLARVAPSITSFSPPVKTEGSDSLNTIVWWRVDSTNDGTANYDRVVLTVFPRSDSGLDADGRTYVFDIGEYSPWLGVRAIWRDEVRDGWCKIRVFRQPDGRYRAMTSQILFDVRNAVSQYTYPEALADELSSRFDCYLPSKFLKKEVVPAVTREAARYASFFYDYEDWDLFYYVFTQTDNIQHLEGFSERSARVYEEIDRFLGELMERLPEESTLIVASDHGFAGFESGIDLNELFEQMGLLVRKPGGDEIDFDRTLVFHNMWHLFFNHELLTRENLEAAGISLEPSETPADALARFLNSREVRSADGSEHYPLEFRPVAADMAGDDPDMVVEGAYDNYMVEFWNLKRPRGGVVFPLLKSEAHNHERNGVFLVWGNHVRAGYEAGVKNIEDIAPTTLYLLGLPSAADMDGRTMFDVFDKDLISALEFFVVPDYSGITPEFFEVEKEKDSLEKKLRSLGYVH